MEHVNACKGVLSRESDWLLGSSQLTLLEDLQKQDNIIMQDNQYTRLNGALRMFCTGFNPMMSILSIYNIQWDEFERNEYWRYAQNTFGYEEGVGNYTSTGVDCARKYWNEQNIDKQVNSWRRDVRSEEIKTVLDYGYGVVVSYKGNKDYNNDYQTDNVLNGNSFGPHTYGHVTCVYKMGSSYYVVDSTYGKPYNVYKLLASFAELVDNGVFYPSAYVMTQDITEAEQFFKSRYELGIEYGITTIPYEEAEQWKKEVVVQDVNNRLGIMEEVKKLLINN